MSRILEFWLVLGNTFDGIEELKFNVVLDEFKEDTMNFIVEFETPELLSIGYTKELLVAKILDQSFFRSESSYQTTAENSVITYTLPKMTSL